MSEKRFIGWGELQSICLADKFCHLYEFSYPVNLNKRFDSVDVEATPTPAAVVEILPTTLHMKGPLSYIGGKNRIANKIIEIFPNHRTYAELFGGGAQVLFRKEPSPVEVLNDLDGDVVTFFRVCQSHYGELVRYLKFVLASRAWFDLLEKQDPTTLTDVQRAARFFYLQKNAYAGLIRHRNFRYSVEEPSGFNPERIPELIENTHKRLSKVLIECQPYEHVLRRYDRPGTLFYLDPPYFGRKLYNFDFTEADFITLEARLHQLRGKFVLSLNDVPDVRRIFRRFDFIEIDLAYTAQSTAGKRYHELLITNYRPRLVHSDIKP
jgi:DNA adenine methylase